MTSYAIYFEFGRDTDVYQCLFIPATLLGAHMVKPTFCYKELTEAQARRTWNVQTNPGYELKSDPPTNITDLLGHELTQLDGLAMYITSILADPDYKTTGVFPVELTQTDLLALKENERKMPVDLNVRIKATRLAKGFPALPETKR